LVESSAILNSMALFLWRYFILAAAIAKASQPKLHTVTVGLEGNFVFDPETTYADVGDVIVFEFFPVIHYSYAVLAATNGLR
jgi:plastocyanin